MQYEAICALDTLLQLTVLDLNAAMPPDIPVEADPYIVGVGPADPDCRRRHHCHLECYG
jgi:hypothetical protein